MKMEPNARRRNPALRSLTAQNQQGLMPAPAAHDCVCGPAGAPEAAESCGPGRSLLDHLEIGIGGESLVRNPVEHLDFKIVLTRRKVFERKLCDDYDALA